MKKTILAIYFFLYVIALGMGQDTVKCFITTSDFNENKLYEKLLKPHIKSSGLNYYKISKMTDETGDKDKRASWSWAIYYKNEYYINLRFCNEYLNMELFAKPALIGKYVVIDINEETPQKIKNGGINYGGGFQGVLISGSKKWGKSWDDQYGNKHRLIVFDTSNLTIKYKDGKANASGILLGPSNINEVLHKLMGSGKIKNMKYEDVMALINAENEKVINGQ